MAIEINVHLLWQQTRCEKRGKCQWSVVVTMLEVKHTWNMLSRASISIHFHTSIGQKKATKIVRSQSNEDGSLQRALQTSKRKMFKFSFSMAQIGCGRAFDIWTVLWVKDPFEIDTTKLSNSLHCTSVKAIRWAFHTLDAPHKQCQFKYHYWFGLSLFRRSFYF